MPEGNLCKQPGCGKPITFKQSTTRFKADGSPGWDLFNPDGTPHTHERLAGGGAPRAMRTQAELHDIRREAVLNAAVAYVVGKMAASGPEVAASMNANIVLATAKAFLTWVEEDRPST